jgi:hypothetical protein
VKHSTNLCNVRRILGILKLEDSRGNVKQNFLLRKRLLGPRMQRKKLCVYNGIIDCASLSILTDAISRARPGLNTVVLVVLTATP